MDYQIYALKLGEIEDATSTFLYRNKSKEIITLFCYFWCIKNNDSIILVDTGFTPQMAKERGIKDYLNPVEQLKQIDIEANSIDKVIITHLHYDHFGGYEYFPNAVFYIQKSEIDAWSSEPLSGYEAFKSLVRPEFMSALEKLDANGKVKLINGDEELFQGINVVLAGGHSPGLQFVTVETKNKKVVLASDACHLHENLIQGTPSSIFVNLMDCLNAIKKLKTYSQDIIIPGHAPETLDKFQKINEMIVEI